MKVKSVIKGDGEVLEELREEDIRLKKNYKKINEFILHLGFPKRIIHKNWFNFFIYFC